ncbi:hypothetical protein, partial [Pseudomonas jinjuensis]|uniref:hypothetical protein n=1 Tax=Pseudomonas jinjuensis TaxID=198616 RepID=UPI001C3FB269
WLRPSLQPRRAFYANLSFRQALFSKFSFLLNRLRFREDRDLRISGRRILQRSVSLSSTSMIVADHHSSRLAKLKCLIFKNFVGVVDWSGAHYRDLKIPVNGFLKEFSETPRRPEQDQPRPPESKSPAAK